MLLRRWVCVPLFLCAVSRMGVAQTPAATPLSRDAEEQYQARIQALEERLALVEDTLKTLMAERGAPGLPQIGPPVQAPAATAIPAMPVQISPPARGEFMPPELVPEIGKIGAEVGIITSASLNPYRLDKGENATAFIDLPLFDRPSWIHGKLSYEISIGLSNSRSSFTTTSNVAQVANLTVLNALNPNGGIANVAAAVSGTGPAPFPVQTQSVTTMKLLQVAPFSFKYTSTLLDRFRIRPYGLLGFGAYVTIHEQSPEGTGVRLNADLPPSTLALVNQIFGGQAPFGGPLVAGQISQSPELEARGLPAGHGNIDFGWLTGGGFEYRLTRSLSLGFDGRWNRIAGAPGALSTLGMRFGFHF